MKVPMFIGISLYICTVENKQMNSTIIILVILVIIGFRW